MNGQRVAGAAVRAAAVALAVLGGGCDALPRSGPLTISIDPPDADVDGLVVQLTSDIAAQIPEQPSASFPETFLEGNVVNPAIIGVDDVLDVTVWESGEAGILSTAGGRTVIDGLVVDETGKITVPFVGPVQASGLTIASLRHRLRDSLEPLTLSPQVDVRLREARSRAVTIQGEVASPGVYVIERATGRLAQMLAEAGGVQTVPESVEISVHRDGQIGRQILSEVFDTPELNIPLRPGDLIIASPIRERFVVLGAATIQAELTFPTRPLSLLSAVAAARGLNDFDADPSGVFLLRFEQPAIADALLQGPVPAGLPEGDGRPIIYRLDLSKPEGLFVAKSFPMRDGDALFITNAPLTELRKFLQLFNAVVTPVNTANTLPLQ